MNVFFVMGNTIVTSDLESETILAGVTRDSAITVLKEMGYTLEEREISIDEIINAYRSGKFAGGFWHRYCCYYFHDQRIEV